MNQSTHRLRLVMTLIGLPASALLIGLAMAAITWDGLPPSMIAHWGVGGAESAMDKRWAVGIPLSMCAAPSFWAIARSVSVRADPRRLFDTGIMCGLIAWIGLGTLGGSIWSNIDPGNGAAPALLVLLPAFVLTALTGWYVWRELRRNP